MGRSVIIVTTKTFRYGLGIVAEEYVEGQMIDIEVELHTVQLQLASADELAEE